MGAHTEKRIEQRHDCRGTMNWVYFNKECYGAARVLNFSQNGSSFETDQALVLGSTVLVHVFNCMNCVDATKTPASLRWDALAEVKWCHKLCGSDNTPYTVGVRYHYPV
jgi:hypothetical protein